MPFRAAVQHAQAAVCRLRLDSLTTGSPMSLQPARDKCITTSAFPTCPSPADNAKLALGRKANMGLADSQDAQVQGVGRREGARGGGNWCAGDVRLRQAAVRRR